MSTICPCVDYAPGEVFFYRSRGKIYGAVFLFRRGDFCLIAISEEIERRPQDLAAEDVLCVPLYTMAWFSDVDLLSARRIHRLDTVEIKGDYSNRAGLLIGPNGGVIVKNNGQSATWRHEFRAFSLPGAAVRDALDLNKIPLSQP